ncbi:CHY zinc finger protein [Corynebacterium pacaense]|uniref:CHY zinc finger protein n=1 Tax=Corynebacterium pacaense TaxID=1816684 RepID=UPI0009B97573|nr:CHY zinc finger protein [Corynebacterium pacaense]
MGCRHYNSEYDVVLNRCSTCGEFWACHLCHAEATEHPFGRMPLDAPDSTRCGACGLLMGYAEYSAQPRCPGCGHPFNPGCSLHAGIYFDL